MCKIQKLNNIVKGLCNGELSALKINDNNEIFFVNSDDTSNKKEIGYYLNHRNNSNENFEVNKVIESQALKMILSTLK